MFTDKEKFITAMTIYVTSDTARKIPREKRQSILLYIRNRYCPTVTDKDWSDIAQDINNHKEEFLSHASETIETADDNPEVVMSDPGLSQLDSEMNENSEDVDLDEFEENVENVSEENDTKFNIKKAFRNITSKKEEKENTD